MRGIIAVSTFLFISLISAGLSLADEASRGSAQCAMALARFGGFADYFEKFKSTLKGPSTFWASERIEYDESRGEVHAAVYFHPDARTDGMQGHAHLWSKDIERGPHTIVMALAPIVSGFEKPEHNMDLRIRSYFDYLYERSHSGEEFTADWTGGYWQLVQARFNSDTVDTMDAKQVPGPVAPDAEVLYKYIPKHVHHEYMRRALARTRFARKLLNSNHWELQPFIHFADTDWKPGVLVPGFAYGLRGPYQYKLQMISRKPSLALR